MYELELRLDHDLPFTPLSKAFPTEKIERWCNLLVDILEIECSDQKTVDKVERELRKLTKALSAKLVRVHRYTERSLEAVVGCRCSINNSSIALMESANCIPIMPVSYSEGLEHCKLFAFTKHDLDSAMKKLSGVSRELTIESKSILPKHSARSALTISFDDFFRTLTQKQFSAFASAIEMGYYNIPKKVTMAEIASKQGVPRSTFEEHLRKAEIKMLQSLKPYTRLGSYLQNLHTEMKPKRKL